MKNKKLLRKSYPVILLTAILLGGVFIIADSQTISLGDANSDGIVNIIDAMLVAQYAAGLNPSPFNSVASDINCDGVVNILDALGIARYSAGLIPTITCSPTPTPAPATTVPGYGIIINASSAKLITPGTIDGSAVVVQRNYLGSQYAYHIQEWEFRKVDDYYAITNDQTGMVLTVKDVSTQAGAYVVPSDLLASSNTHQQWQFLTTPSGYVKIVNRNSGLYLGIEGASLLDNARLVQVAPTEGAEILWGTSEVIPPPSPTGCDVFGKSFCFRASSITVKENSAEPAAIQITATKLTATQPPVATGSNIVVNYTLRGNAINGEDVEYLSGQVSVFARNYTDGDMTNPPADGKITIKPLDDSLVEGIETLIVNISYPPITDYDAGTVIFDVSGGIVYLVDDDLN